MKEKFPVATYRLQFNQDFTFQKAHQLIDYFHQLGISHCYTSPLLKTKAGSTHGYDIVDHSQLNHELGTDEEFNQLCQKFHETGMGVICDIVPNHMCISGSSNKWWMDVLENGESSPYASYFDIDWHPKRRKLDNKLLLPILEQQYGDALEAQDLKVIYQEGSFYLDVSNNLLPTSPQSWEDILKSSIKNIQNKPLEESENWIELQSIITAISHLPETTEMNREKIEERQREKESIKKRLNVVVNSQQEFLTAINQTLNHLNGQKGNPESFDQLESFIDAQPYRLCFWRVANDEINYRRFFDNFNFAGIRAEKSEVFKAMHELIFKWIEDKLIDGVRIDHIDGLWDPEKYLKDLVIQFKKLRPQEEIYTVVEKILTNQEKLRDDWPIQGTVGYEFLNQLNGIYVYQPSKTEFYQNYAQFTGMSLDITEHIYQGKHLTLTTTLSSELHVLARHLDRISEQHRSSRDFTSESLKSALRDVIAYFPVYRTYIQSEDEKIEPEDRHVILQAISKAKRRNPTFSISIFDFIRDILLLKEIPGINKFQKKEREYFVMRFQQLTGPVMAKGVEDMVFYRFYPLPSLAEVGSNLYAFGIDIDMFHRNSIERLKEWPYSMLATSTHDTKRSEDVRARINVLSEIPTEWSEAIRSWASLNEQAKEKDEEWVVPDPNEEYLIYTTLIGTWPVEKMNKEDYGLYVERIQSFMEKAIKEARVYSSWINPNQEYDQKIKEFIQRILKVDFDENGHRLENKNVFMDSFIQFMKRIIPAGMLNSLSQVMIKLTSPGVPDIYQGNERWNFSLVDPDNRRKVDYSHALNLLEECKTITSKEALESIIQYPEGGLIKFYITKKCLEARHDAWALFSKGAYHPLEVIGGKGNHVIGFARIFENQIFLSLSGRFFNSLLTENGSAVKVLAHRWQNTRVKLPVESPCICFRDRFTNEVIECEDREGEKFLDLEKVFFILPMALLEGIVLTKTSL